MHLTRNANKKITRNTCDDDNNTKDVEIAIPLKYLSNFEMLLINGSADYVISAATGKTKFP